MTYEVPGTSHTSVDTFAAVSQEEIAQASNDLFAGRELTLTQSVPLTGAVIGTTLTGVCAGASQLPRPVRTGCSVSAARCRGSLPS